MGELDVKMPRKLGALGRWMTSELEKTRSTTIEDANEPASATKLYLPSKDLHQSSNYFILLTYNIQFA